MPQVYDFVLSNRFKADYDHAHKNPSLRTRLKSLQQELWAPFEKNQAEKLTGGAYTPRYSLRVNDDYRIIFDLSGAIIIYRALDKHDASYRRAKSMPPPDFESAVTLTDLSRTKIRSRKTLAKANAFLSKPITSPIQIEPENIPEISLNEIVPDPLEKATPRHESYLLLASEIELQFALAADIAQWMLFLPEQHRDYVTQARSGPTRIYGPSGTGKTCILLHRAMHLALTEQAPVLIVTFKPTLAKVLTRLKDTLCRKNNLPAAFVNVLDLQTMASKVAGVNSTISQSQQAQLLFAARQQVSPTPASFERKLKRYQDIDSYVGNEVDNWIKGADCQLREDYLTLPFPRGKGELNATEREWFFDIYEAYEQAKGKGLDAQDVLARAESIASRPAFRSTWHAILVDEFQDLNCRALRLLNALAGHAPELLFFVGDHRQRIYRTMASFSKAGVLIKGRSLPLSVNYRNTPEIYNAARILCGAPGEDPDADQSLDLGNSETACLRASACQPVLRFFSSNAEENCWICDQILRLAQDGTPLGDIAVISLNMEQSEEFNYHSTFSTVMLDNPLVDRLSYFDKTAVKRTTIYEAKGLEFPVVFLMGLSQSAFAADDIIRTGDEVEAIISALLYVAMTRARDRLTLSFTGKPLRLLRAAHTDHFSIDAITQSQLTGTT